LPAAKRRQSNPSKSFHKKALRQVLRFVWKLAKTSNGYILTGFPVGVKSTSGRGSAPSISLPAAAITAIGFAENCRPPETKD